jgi:predicted dehydrogenase
MDVGCYCLSALRLVCGEPERVSAELVEGGDGVDARAAAVLRFPGDVLGTIHCGMDVPMRRGVEVHGRDAVVHMVPWPSPGPITVEREGSEPEVVPSEEVDLWARELELFADEEEPPFGRADAVGQARAIEALYDSASPA